MKSTVTVRLDDDLTQKLAEASEPLGQSRSEIIRGALRRQLSVFGLRSFVSRLCPLPKPAAI